MLTGRARRLAATALVLPLTLLSACGDDDDDSSSEASASGSEEESSGGGDGDLTVAVVTHGAAGDAFWDVVMQGAEDAGSDLGVTVEYQSDGDPEAQAQLIDAAVEQGVDGLVVSMANPDALQDSIGAAVDADIPVITINSGSDRSAEFGALTHVGQEERIAGEGAGEELAEAGVTNLICVVHEAGNVGLEDRCAGAEDTLGGTVEPLQVDGNDLAEAVATIRDALQADTSIDGVLALNPGVAVSARDAIAEAGSEAGLATFDLNGDVVEAIEAGEILFAIDQQQYLQGYLPISFLKLYDENLNTVGGGRPVLTGPGFVTAENAADVADLADAGTR
ncbi:MAG: sugar ABC transporter substrate-binding protein [Acidimicrobiales bacterium]